MVKKTTRLLLLLFILVSSCKLIDFEEGSKRAITRKQKKLNALCMQFPAFCTKDSVKGEVKINNPVAKKDTIVKYIDSVRIKTISTMVFEKCKDQNLANSVKKALETAKCIKDSIVIEDTLFKAKITQDSVGAVRVQIFPKEVELKAKYKAACPPQGIIKDSYYDHSEFWFLIFILAIFVIGVLLHLEMVKKDIKKT